MTAHDEYMLRQCKELGEKWHRGIRREYRESIRRRADDYTRDQLYRSIPIPPIVHVSDYPEARCLAIIRYLAKRLHDLKAQHGDGLPPVFNLAADDIASHRVWIQGEINALKAIRARRAAA